MRNLFLAVILAALTFGGTFTCRSGDDDDDDDHIHLGSESGVGSPQPVQSGDTVTLTP